MINMRQFGLLKVGSLFVCKPGVILVSECSVFSQRKLWPPSLILKAAEGWGEKEGCTKGRSTVKNKENSGVGE